MAEWQDGRMVAWQNGRMCVRALLSFAAQGSLCVAPLNHARPLMLFGVLWQIRVSRRVATWQNSSGCYLEPHRFRSRPPNLGVVFGEFRVELWEDDSGERLLVWDGYGAAVGRGVGGREGGGEGGVEGESTSHDVSSQNETRGDQ